MMWTYTSKTDAELETLAWDIIGGKVFGSWDIKNPDMLRMSFMVLAFMEATHMDEIKQNDIAHVYEYMDKAGPRSVNGMPCFFSASYLNKADALKLLMRCQEIAELREQRMNT